MPVWQTIAVSVSIIVLGLGLWDFVELIVRPLALLFAAIVIAEALSPLVERMDRKIPRTLAIIIPYVVVLAIVVGVGWLIYPTLVDQAQQLADRGPEIINRIQNWLNGIDPTSGNRVGDLLTNRFGQASSFIGNLPFTIVSAIVEIILVIAMSIYWLIAKPSFREFFLSLFPESRRDKAANVTSEMGHSIGGYVRAELLTGLIIGVSVYIGLTIIGVEYVIVLAVIAALGELVPVLGPFIAAVPAIAVALLTSPTQAIIVAVFYLILQQIESNILAPNIMAQQADISPLLAIFSLYVGATIGGILGALIAVPLAAGIKVLVERVLAPAVKRWSGADRGEDPTTTDERA